MPRDDLEDGPDDIAGEPDRDGLPSAELVASGECSDGSEECAELVGRVSNTHAKLHRASRSLTEKQLEVIPEMFAALVSGKYFLKSAEIKTPEKTP